MLDTGLKYNTTHGVKFDTYRQIKRKMTQLDIDIDTERLKKI